MKIAIDFDGTCVTHEYPEIGKSIGAEPVLKALVKKGHKLILFTMRSGEELDEAVRWWKDNKIELWGINRNPEQGNWTQSPKAYAELYIDDASLGCPLTTSFTLPDGSRRVSPYRQFVDWKRVRQMLEERGIL